MTLRFAFSAALFALLPACAPTDVGSESAALGSTSVVLSQVYTAGGNSGANLKSSYVELFNRGTAAQPLTNWSLQYASSTSATWSTRYTFTAGSIPAGGYYLVELHTGTTGAALSQTPDATASTFLAAAAAGKIALVNTATALTCGATAGTCSADTTVVDLFGYGAASDYETAAAAAPPSGNNTYYVRGNHGCTDANDNATDFTQAAVPTDVTTLPVHTSASTAAPCAAASSPDMTVVPTVDLAGHDFAGEDLAGAPTTDLAHVVTDAAMTPGNVVEGTTPKNGNAGCSTNGTPDLASFLFVLLALVAVRYARSHTAGPVTRP